MLIVKTQSNNIHNKQSLAKTKRHRSTRAGPPWLLGGLDMHETSAWGLNAAASGWSHQNDAITNLTSGIQTAGPSSKGGADI